MTEYRRPGPRSRGRDIPEPSRRLGRPRDAEIDKKIVKAAAQLYADEGWAGFTFEAISRRAGVGKPAVYLRWSSRMELLRSALGFNFSPTTPDTGSFRDDLMDYGIQQYRWYQAPESRALTRLQLDLTPDSELDEAVFLEINRPAIETIKVIVRRAIARGEVEPSLDWSTVAVLMGGSVFTRIYATPPSRRPALDATVLEFVATVVDVIVRGTNQAVPDQGTEGSVGTS